LGCISVLCARSRSPHLACGSDEKRQKPDYTAASRRKMSGESSRKREAGKHIHLLMFDG
jgi:hypothetical protein